MNGFPFILRRLYSIPGIPYFERSCPSNYIFLIATPSDPCTLCPPSTMVDPMDRLSLCWGCRLWHSTQVQEIPSIGGGEWNQCQSEIHLCICWYFWWGKYVVSDPNPYVGGGTQVTTAVTLNTSDTARFGKPVFPDDWVGMVGYQPAVVIPQYNMIVKYDLKGYADQGALT